MVPSDHGYVCDSSFAEVLEIPQKVNSLPPTSSLLMLLPCNARDVCGDHNDLSPSRASKPSEFIRRSHPPSSTQNELVAPGITAVAAIVAAAATVDRKTLLNREKHTNAFKLITANYSHSHNNNNQQQKSQQQQQILRRFFFEASNSLGGKAAIAAAAACSNSFFDKSQGAVVAAVKAGGGVATSELKNSMRNLRASSFLTKERLFIHPDVYNIKPANEQEHHQTNKRWDGPVSKRSVASGKSGQRLPNLLLDQARVQKSNSHSSSCRMSSNSAGNILSGLTLGSHSSSSSCKSKDVGGRAGGGGNVLLHSSWSGQANESRNQGQSLLPQIAAAAAVAGRNSSNNNHERHLQQLDSAKTSQRLFSSSSSSADRSKGAESSPLKQYRVYKEYRVSADRPHHVSDNSVAPASLAAVAASVASQKNYQTSSDQSLFSIVYRRVQEKQQQQQQQKEQQQQQQMEQLIGNVRIKSPVLSTSLDSLRKASQPSHQNSQKNRQKANRLLPSCAATNQEGVVPKYQFAPQQNPFSSNQNANTSGIAYIPPGAALTTPQTQIQLHQQVGTKQITMPAFPLQASIKELISRSPLQICQQFALLPRPSLIQRAVQGNKTGGGGGGGQSSQTFQTMDSKLGEGQLPSSPPPNIYNIRETKSQASLRKILQTQNAFTYHKKLHDNSSEI